MQESVAQSDERVFRPLLSSDLFLRYVSFQDSNYFKSNIRQAIRTQFDRLSQEYPKRAAIFERFIYDPGLNKDCRVEEENHWQKITAVDPNFSERQKQGVKILMRNSIFHLAENKIMNGDNIAFIHFDIKDLRLADMVGYAEHMLRDFALVLNTVAAEEEQLELIPARVGGDEFVIMVSSHRTIQEHMLETIYEKAKTLFGRKTGFYMVDENAAIVEKRQANLKEKKSKSEHFIIANSKQDKRNFLVKALSHGNIPDKECFRHIANTSGDEFSKTKAHIRKRMLWYFHMDQDKMEQEIQVFFRTHPEFSEQGEVVSFLLGRGETELATSFYTILKEFLFDPVVKKEAYHINDYLRHLQLVGVRPNTRIITLSLPWTKNFNSSGDPTKTDKIILALFEFASNLQNPFNLFISSPSLARDGGDIIFVSDQYLEGILWLAKSFPLPGRFRQLFKDKIPVTISSMDLPKDIGPIHRLTGNMKDLNRVQFFLWLNKFCYEDPDLASLYAEYYLTEREEDRKRSMRFLAKHLPNLQLHPQIRRILD